MTRVPQPAIDPQSYDTLAAHEVLNSDYGLAAIGLHALMRSWLLRHPEANGEVWMSTLAYLGSPQDGPATLDDLIQILVEAGLWQEVAADCAWLDPQCKNH